MDLLLFTLAWRICVCVRIFEPVGRKALCSAIYSLADDPRLHEKKKRGSILDFEQSTKQANQSTDCMLGFIVMKTEQLRSIHSS
jgi:hypothetical protein